MLFLQLKINIQKELPGTNWSLDNFEISDLEKPLLNFFHNENLKIIEYSRKQRLKLGSTCTVAVIFDNTMLIVHVGDTRVYCISDNITKLTVDHSLVQLEVSQGILKPEEAEIDPRRNVLIQCIGVDANCEPDVIYRTVKKDEIYLVCSDGFRHEVQADELFSLYKNNVNDSEKDLEKVTSSIIDLVKERGETDNISCIAIRVKE